MYLENTIPCSGSKEKFPQSFPDHVDVRGETV